jgi:hypothetical protein
MQYSNKGVNNEIIVSHLYYTVINRPLKKTGFFYTSLSNSSLSFSKSIYFLQHNSKLVLLQYGILQTPQWFFFCVPPNKIKTRFKKHFLLFKSG